MSVRRGSYFEKRTDNGQRTCIRRGIVKVRIPARISDHVHLEIGALEERKRWRGEELPRVETIVRSEDAPNRSYRHCHGPNGSESVRRGSVRSRERRLPTHNNFENEVPLADDTITRRPSHQSVCSYLNAHYSPDETHLQANCRT